MKWQKAKLEDLAFFQRGFDLLKVNFKDGEYPVISSSGLQGYHAVKKVYAPGVIIGRKGTLGTVHYVDSDYWPHDTTLWVKDFKDNYPRYVYYFLQTLDLARFDSGGANPTLNRNHIHGLEILKPPLSTQKRIADILSKYDDLIENNNRRIALLEESVHLLYREWFVRLRFPGHESVRVVDGVPEGWERVKLPTLCTVIDGTHDSPKPVSQGYYLVTGKHIVNGFIDFSSCYLISETEHKKVMQRSKPERGDIIFSNIGTLGSTVLVDQNFEFSIKNVALFKPYSSKYSSFIYCHFSDIYILESLTKKASGTSQRFFSLNFLRSIEVLKPTEEILFKFNQLVSPQLSQRSLLYRQNQKLKEARDSLLPRLMNGSIEV